MVSPEPGEEIMSSREAIFSAIRANLPKLERAAPLVPLFDEALPSNLLAAFGQALAQMGGELLPPDAKEPLAPARARLKGAKLVCSRVPEISGNKPISVGMKAAELADVEYGILRAAFAVAETGSVCLTEHELGLNTLGYLPQHLIILLDPADIVPNIHHAYRRRELREGRYTVFHSGPSATADIEGVLIHGAQGVRSLSVLAIARS
jgi:L-lactate dehydrogenase complex protein LldG